MRGVQCQEFAKERLIGQDKVNWKFIETNHGSSHLLKKKKTQNEHCPQTQFLQRAHKQLGFLNFFWVRNQTF